MQDYICFPLLFSFSSCSPLCNIFIACVQPSLSFSNLQYHFSNTHIPPQANIKHTHLCRSQPHPNSLTSLNARARGYSVSSTHTHIHLHSSRTVNPINAHAPPHHLTHVSIASVYTKQTKRRAHSPTITSINMHASHKRTEAHTRMSTKTNFLSYAHTCRHSLVRGYAW